jgi:hypothetical protein
MAKEIISDERVKELQEEWNPAQYDTEPDGFTKDMLIRVSSTFYDMSVEEYRKVLEDSAVESAPTTT